MSNDRSLLTITVYGMPAPQGSKNTLGRRDDRVE